MLLVLLCGKVEGYQNILKLRHLPLAFTLNEAFCKERAPEIVSFCLIKYSVTRTLIKVEYLFISMQISKKLFNHVASNKPIGNKFMLLDNHQQLYHTFFESYIDQEHILFNKDLQK